MSNCCKYESLEGIYYEWALTLFRAYQIKYSAFTLMLYKHELFF